MPVTKSFAGSSFSLPVNREPKTSSWGIEVSNFLIALADQAIPKTGGLQTLAAELNFGASFGVLAPYFKSASSNIAATGISRFANNEGIGWRNAANTADLVLKIDASNKLAFGTSAVSEAELGYLSGVTSAIQTQLGSLQASGNYITALTGHVTAAGPGSVAASIANNVITDAMVNSAAAIAGSKVAPSFGAQNISTTGTLASGAATVTGTLSASGQAMFGSGTVGVPGISFAGDTSTGLYRIGATQIGFTSNGIKDGEFNLGNWQLGRAIASSTSLHRMYGRNSDIGTGNYVLSLQANNAASGDVTLGFGLDATGSSGSRYAWLAPVEAGVGAAGLRFGAHTTEVGKYTPAGAWTVGPSGSTAINLIVNGKVAPTENVVIALGKGIDFNLSSHTAGMTAEILDDYEEGTWTPVASYTTPGSMSSTQTSGGIFTKIGRVVTVTGWINFSAFSKGTASGVAIITGLPFAVSSAVSVTFPGSLYTENQTFTSHPGIRAMRGTSQLNLHRTISNSTAQSIDDYDANSEFYFTCTYQT